MHLRYGGYLLLLGCWCALQLMGCGGTQTGSAQLSMCWPAAGSATELGGVQSMTLAVRHNKSTVATRTLNRAHDDITSVQIANVPVGSYSYLATAYAGADGKGATLGTATGMVDIARDLVATLSLTTQADAHAVLSITPATRTVSIDDRLSYSARLLNPDGSQVMLPAHQLSWSVDDPDIATIDAALGKAQGHHPGTTTIRLQEAGTEREASAALTVAAKPASVFIYADSPTIAPGQLVTLRWQALNADRVVRSVGFYADTLSGTITVSPTVTTTYAITVAGPSGEASGQTIVVVQAGK